MAAESVLAALIDGLTEFSLDVTECHSLEIEDYASGKVDMYVTMC